MGDRDPSSDRGPRRGFGGASIALRLAVALQCAGLVWAWRAGASKLSSAALMQAGWSGDAVARLDQVLVAVLAGLAIWAVLRAHAIPCLAIAALFAAETTAHTLGHERFAELAPAAASLRVAAPVALWLVARRSPHAGSAEALLRVSVAATFVAHGVEAWARHPEFIDLILATDFRLRDRGLGLGLRESHARGALGWIAVHDWILAVLILVTRWRAVALWMAVWGAAAALARTLQGGLVVWGESALRASHGLAPLAILLLVHRRAIDVAGPNDPPH